MAELYPLEQKLALSWPPAAWQDLGVIVAVSGGADSIALLRALARLKVAGPGRLVAAHFNHALRGDEADADVRFVIELCERLDLPVEIGRAVGNLKDAADGEGLEAAARQARYEFLRATAGRLGARYVVTAHTADDQAETVLHRIVRGTGLAGLAGIPRVRSLGPDVSLLRPMLEIRRVEVIEYLAALGQPFREDATNAELRFTRNRLRHELLPNLAADYSPGVMEALVRLGQTAGEVQHLIAGLTAPLHDRAVRYSASGAVVDCQTLFGEPAYLVRELMVDIWRRTNWPQRDMGFDEWRALAEMALATGGTAAKRVFPGAIAAERQGDRLVLRPSGG